MTQAAKSDAGSVDAESQYDELHHTHEKADWQPWTPGAIFMLILGIVAALCLISVFVAEALPR